jgi:non-ribosomal peptide synthetase component E (peptide arylation enzyme)
MVNLSYIKIAFFPVSGNRYLTAEERARAAAALAQQESLAKEEAEQKAQRLAERLRSLGITPMKCKGGFQAILGD